MTAYPGCVTPTEVDPTSVNWGEKPICQPVLPRMLVRRLGEVTSDQTYYDSGTALIVSLGGLSAQTYYGSGTILKIRRVI